MESQLKEKKCTQTSKPIASSFEYTNADTNADLCGYF